MKKDHLAQARGGGEGIENVLSASRMCTSFPAEKGKKGLGFSLSRGDRG